MIRMALALVLLASPALAGGGPPYWSQQQIMAASYDDLTAYLTANNMGRLLLRSNRHHELPLPFLQDMARCLPYADAGQVCPPTK